MGVRIPPPLPTLGGVVMGFIGRIREFVREVIAEFRKVTWPTRQELVNSTAVVVVLTVVVAVFLGVVDVGLTRLVELILRDPRKGL
ncbi:MAG: preprotein translocase subunit SecE [Actinobacteria bacterium]|nr:preprotein translocase subunit SecE [Actinomycetota bacterium]